MKEKDLISIIIPVYNTEEYLRQCLDSVVNQTYKNLEIILINDCSTDNSLQILEEYQKKDNRIILIDLKQRIAVGFVRNEGLKITKGKYVIFVDSDDWASNDYVEILYNAIERYKVDFVSAFYYKFNNITHEIQKCNKAAIKYDTIISTKKDKKIFLKELRYPIICTLWTKIFRKDFLLSNNILFRIVKTEDNLFIWETISKSSNFIFITKYIYYYRVSRKDSIMYFETFEEIFGFYYEIMSLSKTIFKDHVKFFYTYILTDFSLRVENTKVEEITNLFLRFRKQFYNKNYIIDYSYANLKNKIRLLIFSFCLKYNINYSFVVRLHHYVNNIRTVFNKNNIKYKK